MHIKVEVNRNSWLWRPVGKVSRILVLAISMLLVATVAFAGWSAVVATMTGSVGTSSGLSGVFTGVGTCTKTAGSGTVTFGSASGQNMTFTATGLKPDSRFTCQAEWQNTSTLYHLQTVASSQTWLAATSPQVPSNWDPNEVKAVVVNFVPSDLMPENGAALPVIVTLTFIP